MSLQSEVTRLQGIKSNIQTALINKGISGAGSHTMSQFATDIGSIQTGTDVSSTTATASDVLSGKAFYLSNGTKTNGTIATKTSSNMTVSGATVTAPAGYYASSASKSISSGALSTPTISSTGLVTSSVGTSGYLSSGTSSTLQLPYKDDYSVGAMVAGYSAPSVLMNVYTGTIWSGSVQLYEMSGDEFASSISVRSLGGMNRQCFLTPFNSARVIGFYFNGYMGGSTYGTTWGSFLCMPTTSVATSQYTMYLLGSHTTNTSVTFNKAGSGQMWTAAKGWYCSSSTSNFYFNTDYASYSSMYILYCTEAEQF